MLAQFNAFGDLAVCQALGQAVHHFQLTLGEYVEALSIHRLDSRDRRQSFEGHGHLVAVGPDLSLGHAMNALAEHFGTSISAEDAFSPCAEGIKNAFGSVGIQQDYGPDL